MTMYVRVAKQNGSTQTWHTFIACTLGGTASPYSHNFIMSGNK